MRQDILKLVPLNGVPKKGDLYINENKDLHLCLDPEFNKKEGLPGKEIRIVIPTLLNTSLSIDETEELKKFVWINNFKDGDQIILKYNFSY